MVELVMLPAARKKLAKGIIERTVDWDIIYVETQSDEANEYIKTKYKYPKVVKTLADYKNETEDILFAERYEDIFLADMEITNLVAIICNAEGYGTFGNGYDFLKENFFA